MKLLLTLLAILTGFAGGDAARAAPTAPSTFGVAVALAEVVSERQTAPPVHHPQQSPPTCFTPDAAQRIAPLGAVPLQPGLPPRGLRARE